MRQMVPGSATTWRVPNRATQLFAHGPHVVLVTQARGNSELQIVRRPTAAEGVERLHRSTLDVLSLTTRLTCFLGPAGILSVDYGGCGVLITLGRRGYVFADGVAVIRSASSACVGACFALCLSQRVGARAFLPRSENSQMSVHLFGCFFCQK